MNISLSELSTNSVYHLMTQTVVPRPIAWVLSENHDSSLNLAPFSYFNAICSDPPLCILSMGKKPDGDTKDTAVNLSVGAQCVVHIAQVQHADLVTATAATMAYGESEIQATELKLLNHSNWALKRIAECPIAYYCKVHSVQQIGNTPQQVVFVEVLEVYIDDKVATVSNGRISVDALKVNPLARLGANQYASLGEVFSKARPK